MIRIPLAILLVALVSACGALAPSLDTAALTLSVTQGVADAIDALPPTATADELKVALVDALDRALVDARAQAEDSNGEFDPTAAGALGAGLSILGFILARYRRKLLLSPPPKVEAD